MFEDFLGMVILTRLFRFPVKFRDGGTLYDDAARVYVRGGDGGAGLREVGGVGGDGGDVLLLANNKISLATVRRQSLKKRFIAGNGRSSRKLFVLGDRGRDLILKVPAGVTVCTDHDRELSSLNKVGEKVIVAKGGIGGSPKNEYIGEKAIPHMIRLYLKLIADVSLVGFPNAGKSTMLKALSRAKPRISSFPFTTVRPQVGVMEYEDNRKISVADLPGLIDGSVENVGLGHRFLRHIERTTIMLVMVDVNGFQLNPASPYRTAFETLVFLNKELELFNPSVIDKPAILCINKMDSVGAERKCSTLLDSIRNMNERLLDIDVDRRPTRLIPFMDIIPVCAREYNGEPMQRLKNRIRELLDYIDDKKRQEGENDDNVERRPKPDLRSKSLV